LYELQAPYLKIEDAKSLLNPFMVSKVEEVYEESKLEEEQPKLTKSDIFGRLE